MRSELTDNSDEIRAMFDKQLNRMFQLIDHQLSKMAQVAPYDRVVSC